MKHKYRNLVKRERCGGSVEEVDNSPLSGGFVMALFEKGVSGNPAGRPKGLLTGRAKALYAPDQVVAKVENLALIEDACAELPKGQRKGDMIGTAGTRGLLRPEDCT